MRFTNTLLAISLAVLPASLASASRLSQDGSVAVDEVWARMTPNEDDSASVFFEVLNTGEKPDTLLSASSPVAETTILRRGKWRGWDFLNKPTTGIKIKANSRKSFHPGAMEVTLSDFKVPVGVRSTVPVTLVFKQAGTVTIEATVANQLLGNRIKK